MELLVDLLPKHTEIAPYCQALFFPQWNIANLKSLLNSALMSIIDIVFLFEKKRVWIRKSGRNPPDYLLHRVPKDICHCAIGRVQSFASRHQLGWIKISFAIRNHWNGEMGKALGESQLWVTQMQNCRLPRNQHHSNGWITSQDSFISFSHHEIWIKVPVLYVYLSS